MSWLLQMMEQYSVAAVFANVLVEQASALTPGLSDAGADGRAGSRRQICGVDPVPMAVPAAVIADTGWYLVPRLREFERLLSKLICVAGEWVVSQEARGVELSVPCRAAAE